MYKDLRKLAILLLLCTFSGFFIVSCSVISVEEDTKSHTGQLVKTETSDVSLPRILIIGDSISIGYTKGVRNLLQGKAEVYRVPDNCRYTSYGLENIKEWLGDYNWDVIHFNWGIWDLQHVKGPNAVICDKRNGNARATPEQYEDNLRHIIKELKRTDAELIWASTTPIPQVCKAIFAGSEVKYNAIAENIMKENSIVINDLHSYAMLKIQKIKMPGGDVHFTEEGYEYLAKRVASVCDAVLKKKLEIENNVK